MQDSVSREGGGSALSQSWGLRGVGSICFMIPFIVDPCPFNFFFYAPRILETAN